MRDDKNPAAYDKVGSISMGINSALSSRLQSAPVPVGRANARYVVSVYRRLRRTFGGFIAHLFTW